MVYNSTRGGETNRTASEAILEGLCSDGGLFMPDHIPTFERPVVELKDMSYQELAYEVMKLYFTDFTEEELRHCIDAAYDEKFDTKLIAPLVKKDNAYFLELFHGKTIAFKDMALSILPHLMVTSAKKNNVKDTWRKRFIQERLSVFSHLHPLYILSPTILYLLVYRSVNYGNWYAFGCSIVQERYI